MFRYQTLNLHASLYQQDFFRSYRYEILEQSVVYQAVCTVGYGLVSF